MQRRVSVQLAVLLGAVLAGGVCARNAGAAENELQVGTWMIDLSNTKVKGMLKMVIAGSDGNQCVGYIDWEPPKGQTVVEVFSGTFDPTSRTLRFRGREMHTQLANTPLHTFEAILSADGRELTEFHFIGSKNNPRLRGQWTSEAIPMPLPGVAGAVGISSDRDLLYQQLSADYLLGDTLVIHGTDAAALARLEASSDPTTRQLARARAVLQELSNKMVDAGSNTQAAADIGRLKAELGIFIVQAIDEEGRRPDKAAERAIKILNSDVINRMFDRKTIAAEVAAAAIAVIDRTRQALRDDYRKSHSGGPRLDSRAFRAEFKVSNANMGVIALRNGTGRDLHRCLVATHMAVDEKKADAFERSRTEIDPNFAALSAMMGLDLTAAKECDRAIAAFARIDKGTINYVPLWKSGVSIEFSLAMPDVIAITAGAVDTWVGCDEGEAECKLDLKAIKAKLPSQPANNQPAKRSTGRN